MKVVYSKSFEVSYCSDPAAATGRVEAVLAVIRDKVEMIEAVPASRQDIAAVHTESHIEMVRREGLYDIAALAAGGAVQAARVGLTEPCFGLIRPPGHHASAGSAWGFCYFNNMAIALEKLKREGAIQTALVLDFDLHFGDGTVNILGGKKYVSIYNPSSSSRRDYLAGVESFLGQRQVDLIGVSAGFDNHQEDWGGLLATEDYKEMGRMVREAARKNKGGYFGILEGGYNHRVLGRNVMAFLEGLES
ncbi:MAG TPA: histone deacetylase family protein [Syntrophales bacterium]|nr:histone deacetylase family protein [Syntrophales bacterium]HOM08050.1 histone deacetylase family protein [Syntrophales bacterium]HON99826.1 histone deacetylase family protein [Syntrophales bacterium]HPC01457.1 histone deacetylase family protein [Syntrophales bacterium]HPQ07479.1 histone deacetylase family protein [Syntrophales bacterium]